MPVQGLWVDKCLLNYTLKIMSFIACVTGRCLTVSVYAKNNPRFLLKLEDLGVTSRSVLEDDGISRPLSEIVHG